MGLKINKGNTTSLTNNSSYGFPAQRIKSSKKTDDWAIACIEAIYHKIGAWRNGNNKSSFQAKELNYKLINGYISLDDIKYVTDPLGMSEELGDQPARIQNYAKVYPKINYLISKEYDSPFNFKVYAVAGGGFNAKNEYKKQQIVNNIHSIIQQQMIELGMLDPSQAVDGQIPLPELDKYMQYSYQDLREQFLNTLLKDIYQKQQLQMKFNKGFFHANAVAEEIYNVSIVNGLPNVRCVNPRYFDYLKTVDLENIEDSNACVEITYMQIGNILDEFREYLTDEEIDRLESQYGSSGSLWGRLENELGIIPNHKDIPDSRESGIAVVRTTWKSMKLIQFIKYLDENGEIQETTIDDDTWKVPQELEPYIIEYNKEWITDVWEGVKINIADPIYPYARPVANQVDGKLPYVGSIYNNINSEAKSTVDFLKPYQYAINIYMYRMELEVAKADGKKLLIDMAQIPKSQGIGLKEWFYYMKNMGVVLINSAEEGLDQMGNTVSKFNQMSAVDLTISNNIVQYINIIDKLEAMMDEIVGISRQAQGDIAASETATGVNRAITQTTVITRPLFIKHNDVKRRVIELLLETCKLCMLEGSYKVAYMDDMMKNFLEIDGELLNDTEYGLYVTDSVKETESFEILKQAAQVAANNGLIELRDLAHIFKNNSFAEVDNYLKQRSMEKAQLEQDQFNREQEQIQAQRESEEKRYQDQMTLEYNKLDREDINKQLDREANLQKAQISAMGFGEDQDINSNGIPDIAEQTRLALEASSLAFDQTNKILESKRKETELKSKQQVEQSKLNLEREKLAQEKELKKEEFKLTKENMKNDITVAKINKANRPKPK